MDESRDSRESPEITARPDLGRPPKREKVATFKGLLGPLPARLRHGTVVPPERQTLDARGAIGAPYRALDWLELMERRGAISPEMRAGGDRYASDFRAAHLDPLRALRIDRPRIEHPHGPPSAPAAEALSARGRIQAAQRALGGPGSPCERAAWHVLGFGRSVAEWCREEGGWLRQETAKGIVIGALAVLAAHYGMAPGTKPTPSGRGPAAD